jgi:hypothetical protein
MGAVKSRIGEVERGRLGSVGLTALLTQPQAALLPSGSVCKR